MALALFSVVLDIFSFFLFLVPFILFSVLLAFYNKNKNSTYSYKIPLAVLFSELIGYLVLIWAGSDCTGDSCMGAAFVGLGALFIYLIFFIVSWITGLVISITAYKKGDKKNILIFFLLSLLSVLIILVIGLGVSFFR